MGHTGDEVGVGWKGKRREGNAEKKKKEEAREKSQKQVICILLPPATQLHFCSKIVFAAASAMWGARQAELAANKTSIDRLLVKK